MRLKRLTWFVMSIIVLFSNYTIANAEEMEYNDSLEEELSGYKEILSSFGTPENVINEVSESQLKFVADNLVAGASYDSMDSYVCSNNNKGMLRSILSGDRIKVTVLCYKATVNGERQYIIFPSFKWLETGTGIKNDTFAFALYSGWEMVPDSTAQINVKLVNSGGVRQSIVLQPEDASQYGYSYRFPYGTGAPQGWYEGNAICYAIKKQENATNGISVKYIHDCTSFCTVSYGVTIGIASIAVTSASSSNLEIYSRNMSFTYN